MKAQKFQVGDLVQVFAYENNCPVKLHDRAIVTEAKYVERAMAYLVTGGEREVIDMWVYVVDQDDLYHGETGLRLIPPDAGNLKWSDMMDELNKPKVAS